MKKKMTVILVFSLFTSNFIAFSAGMDNFQTSNANELYEKVKDIYRGKDFFIRKTNKGYLVKYRNDTRLVPFDDDAVDCIKDLINRQNLELNESMLKTLLTYKPSYLDKEVYKQKQQPPIRKVVVITMPEPKTYQESRFQQRENVQTAKPSMVTIVAPKEEKKEDIDFYNTLHHLKSKKNEIQVISAKENRKTKTIPLDITETHEPITISEPILEDSYNMVEVIKQKPVISDKLQVLENNNENIDNIEIEKSISDANHTARVEVSDYTTCRKDNYYNSSDFEITKLGNKYRVKRKSDNKVFTLREKNKETVYVKNILAGYDVENNEYELISAISCYQQDQDKNRRRRNRQRLRKAGKFVLGTGLVVATVSALAHISKNGGAEGLSQGLNNSTNRSNKKTPSSTATTDYTSTNYIQNNTAENYVINSPAYPTTKVYGTTNGFQNIGPDAVIETTPYTNTTKVYGTTNGFKNILPKAIIEEDPYSNTTKVYGTTNGFKNISPNTIIERDSYSNTTKVYGTTNGFKNISPNTIIERDPYSNTTKVYGTTNGFRNISPNTIIERDPYSNTTKVYGTTNGFKNISPKAIIEEDPYSNTTKVYGTTNGIKNISPNAIIKRSDY